MLRRLLAAKKAPKETKDEEKPSKSEEKETSVSTFDTESIIKAFAGPEIRFEGNFTCFNDILLL